MTADSEMTEIDVTDVEPFTEEEMFTLVRRAIADPGSFLPREDGETVSNWGARAVVEVIDEDARNRAAARIADETKVEAMDFRNGMEMRLLPAQTIAARTVAAARTLLGDAPNYSETTVEFTTKLAGETEKYSFVVQRIAPGKLTPHEARQQAEADRDRARADAKQWHDTYQDEVNARDEFFGHLLELLPGAEDTGMDAYDQIPRGIENLRADRDRARDAAVALEQENARLTEQMADVEKFVAARAEYITAINNCPPDNSADYWRWQGHAEGRRQLSQTLGLPVGWPAGYDGGEAL